MRVNSHSQPYTCVLMSSTRNTLSSAKVLNYWEYPLGSIEHKLGVGSSLIFSLLLWWLNSCFRNLISATQFTCLPHVSCFEAKNRWMCSLWHGQVKICLLPVLDSEVCSGERTNVDPQPMTFGFSLFCGLFSVSQLDQSSNQNHICGQQWCSSGQLQSCQYLTETYFLRSL